MNDLWALAASDPWVLWIILAAFILLGIYIHDLKSRR